VGKIIYLFALGSSDPLLNPLARSRSVARVARASTNFLQGEHKKLHKSKGNFLSSLLTPKVVSEPDPDTGLYDPFPTFPYTGTLRPVYPLSEHRDVPKSIQHPDYWKDGNPRSERTLSGRSKIEILNKEQQEGMRKVCRLAREVLDIAAAAAKPGVTTDYIDEIVHKACLERDVRSQ
jgi:methionyl aminopeptidase